MTTAVTMLNRPLAPTGPLGSLDAYIQSVGSIAVLSREDEQALSRRYRDEQDLDAARQLVMSHLRFVVHIAKGYTGYGLPLGDLIQEGNVGLMKAVKRFNPEVGVRLISFAVHWIKAEMHEFILRNWRIVKVATTKAQRKLFFNLRSSKRRLAWLTQDETRAMAEELGVSEEEVARMEGRMAASDLSFDGFDDDDDGDSTFFAAAYLPSPNSDPAMLMENEDWHDDATSRMTDALEDLDERSRHILETRWLAEKKQTLHELAHHYGISAERIRQIEGNAIKKLRAAMEA